MSRFRMPRRAEGDEPVNGASNREAERLEKEEHRRRLAAQQGRPAPKRKRTEASPAPVTFLVSPDAPTGPDVTPAEFRAAHEQAVAGLAERRAARQERAHE